MNDSRLRTINLATLALIGLTGPAKLAVAAPGLDVRVACFLISGLTAAGDVVAMLSPRWFRVRPWLAAPVFGGLGDYLSFTLDWLTGGQDTAGE